MVDIQRAILLAVRGETEGGQLVQRFVPPADLLAGLENWARHAVPGCDLQIAWGHTSGHPIAQVVTLRADPNFRDSHPARASAIARRACQLLTDLQPPLTALLARGARLEDARDVVSLAWQLECQAPRRGESRRARRREVRAIEQAAAIVVKWESTLREKTQWVRIEYGDGRRRQTYAYRFCRDFLPWLADALPHLEPPVGRPAQRHVLLVVRVLEALLRRRGLVVGAQEIAAVPHAAWPTLYRPGEFDRAATARKLVGRARKRVSQAALDRALSCLPSWRPDPAARRVRIPLKNRSGSIELVWDLKRKPRREGSPSRRLALRRRRPAG
jgi:hypothetical protein